MHGVGDLHRCDRAAHQQRARASEILQKVFSYLHAQKGMHARGREWERSVGLLSEYVRMRVDICVQQIQYHAALDLQPANNGYRV